MHCFLEKSTFDLLKLLIGKTNIVLIYAYDNFKKWLITPILIRPLHSVQAILLLNSAS